MRGPLCLAIVMTVASCTKSNPISCVDGYCQDPAYPFCDVDGALEGHPQTCIAVDCTPDAFAGCRGDQAIVCNTTGDNYDLSHCDNGCDPSGGCVQKACVANTTACGDRTVERCDEHGQLHTEACEVACVESPAPHCAYLQPKYLPDVCDALATAPTLEVDSHVTFDTGAMATCNGGVVAQAGGPDICVLRYGTFSIKTGGTAVFTGTRAAAIVTDGTLDVAGYLDVAGRGVDNGPGVSGLSGTSTKTCGGGGGAGFATSGAAGGSSTQTGGGCAGGFGTAPLGRSYFAGGYRANGEIQAPQGGGGGGAAMLVSCRGRVTVTGTISAGGGGGLGGNVQIINVAGGGGGSGGYVVLQGLGVGVTGQLFANGGSGGCGKPSGSAQGANGPDANALTTTTGCVATLGSGGAGGAAGAAPQGGGASTMDTPGGGGGSIGAFQTYTPATIVPTLTPAAASPPFEMNLNVPTR